MGEIARTESLGEPPNLLALPKGCVFNPRCQYAQDVCKAEVLSLRMVGQEHLASCHFADTLALRGI